MHKLVTTLAIFGVAAGTAELIVLPYAYLASPLPVYHRLQDTRTGVHAYSYAGGPSAKEEIRGLDGVTRGSYNYVDANGILQSVFYIADEDGFRVAATNLPTDGDLPHETGEVLLAKNAHLEEYAKAARKHTSREKRSLEAPTDQDRRPENSSSQQDQTDQGSTQASPKSSHELPAVEKKAHEDRSDGNTAQSILAPAYGLLASVLIPKLAGTSTSHQSRVDIHNNLPLRTGQPVQTVGILPEVAYETVVLPGEIPLATSHQSRVQVHNNVHVQTPETAKSAETIFIQPTTTAIKYQLGELPIVSVLPEYQENRIQLHKNLGLEGPDRKDAVKINTRKVVVIQTPIAAESASPIITKEALPLVAAVPNQSKTQIHGNAKLEVTRPIVNEPTLYVATSYVQPIATGLWSIFTPVAQSSQYRSQIHLNEKIEITK